MSKLVKDIARLGMPWEAEYGYVQAVKVGDLIFLAGAVGHDDAGKIEGDMEEQMRRTYANVAKVLSQYGATIDNLVDETLYVTDIDAAWDARVKMKDEVFGGDPQLASTVVQVARLAFPELLLEMRTMAKL
jgi:enamine deaminase RidA (YjgF/YER057c/UK114 family)